MIESVTTRPAARTAADPAPSGSGTTGTDLPTRPTAKRRLDGSLSWARPGRRRRQLHEPEGPSAWDLVRGGLVAAGLAAATWLATLVVVAVAEGRHAAYPFAAVTALFRGERALGLRPNTGEVTTAVLVRGAFWTALMAVLLGTLFAVAALRGRPYARATLVCGAAAAALAVFLLGIVLVGQPGNRTLQREVSSYQGFRDLGLPLVALAQVLAGAVFGAWWARTSTPRRGART